MMSLDLRVDLAARKGLGKRHAGGRCLDDHPEEPDSPTPFSAFGTFPFLVSGKSPGVPGEDKPGSENSGEEQCVTGEG